MEFLEDRLFVILLALVAAGGTAATIAWFCGAAGAKIKLVQMVGAKKSALSEVRKSLRIGIVQWVWIAVAIIATSIGLYFYFLLCISPILNQNEDASAPMRWLATHSDTAYGSAQYERTVDGKDEPYLLPWGIIGACALAIGGGGYLGFWGARKRVCSFHYISRSLY